MVENEKVLIENSGRADSCYVAKLLRRVGSPSCGAFGRRDRLELSIVAPELSMDFGQRAVILTLSEFWSLIRKPYNNLLEGY